MCGLWGGIYFHARKTNSAILSFTAWIWPISNFQISSKENLVDFKKKKFFISFCLFRQTYLKGLRGATNLMLQNHTKISIFNESNLIFYFNLLIEISPNYIFKYVLEMFERNRDFYLNPHFWDTVSFLLIKIRVPKHSHFLF